jgi:hypothetical protein
MILFRISDISLLGRWTMYLCAYMKTSASQSLALSTSNYLFHRLKFALCPYLLILLLWITSIQTISGQETLIQSLPGQSKHYRYEIKPAQSIPTIDGFLEDSVWANVDSIRNFYQTFPYDTSYAQSKTIVKLCHDDRNLYIAAICYEYKEGPHVIQSLKRDFSYPKSDAFAVYIDPLSDWTNGFNFSVNPFGVQREGLIETGGGFGVTTIWDNKWYAEVQRTPKAWIVEIKIPFSSLRYKPGAERWGINFSRQCLKINENSSWVPVPRNLNIASLAFTGDLIWEKPPKKLPFNLALIPYGLGQYSADYAKNQEKPKLNAGLDAKVGITQSLFLDMTINPDFAQVEVDRQVVNLDRFELFFPERRLFFIENSDLFSNFGFSRIRPFFSRRIGLVNDPTGRVTGAVPILGGARLSGKLNTNWRVGALSMQTEGLVDNPTPSNNYTVLAFQRQVLASSNVGFIFVNRQATYGSRFSPNNYNRVLGLDFNLLSKSNRWKGKMFYHHSIDQHMKKESGATAVWIQYNVPSVRINYNHEYIQANYNPEVGYLLRKDLFRFEHTVDFFFYPQSKTVNKHGPFVALDQYYANRSFMIPDFNRFLDSRLTGGYRLYFQNSAILTFSYDELFTRLLDPFNPTNTRRGAFLPAGGQYFYRNVSASFESNFRRRFYYIAGLRHGSYFNGRRTSMNAEINYRWQPWGVMTLAVEQNNIVLPRPYSSADILLLSPKLDLSFSRSVFCMLFVQYNTQVERTNLNARLQWRFRPMSDLFLVITENYDNRRTENNGRRRFDIFDRSIVLKISYWFNT